MIPFASLFVLGVVLLVAGWWAVLAIHNAPEQEPEPSAWDARDGVTPHCTVDQCRAEVAVHVHAGHDWYPFCEGHGTPFLTEGMAK